MLHAAYVEVKEQLLEAGSLVPLWVGSRDHIELGFFVIIVVVCLFVGFLTSETSYLP